MTQRSDTKKKWSRRSYAGCMWGPIGLFDFLGSNSPRFLTNPNYRDGQRDDHRYRRCKQKFLRNFKWKHEIVNRVNQADLGEGKSAAKQVIQKEKFEVKQPKQHSMAASEVTELKSCRSPCIMNYTHMNDTYYEGHSTCNYELKLQKYSKTERYNFWELLQRISNLDPVSLFKERSSRKDKAVHLDPGHRCHSSPPGQDHCEMSDFPDQFSKEKVKDYFIFQQSSSDELRNSACNVSVSDGRVSVSTQENSLSEEFRHFLETLNSDKSLEKVLQDPKSCLVDYTQNPPDGTSKKLHAELSHKTIQESEPLPSGDSQSSKCRYLANDRQSHPHNANKLVLQDESLTKPSKVDNANSQGPSKVIVVMPQSDGSNTAPNPLPSSAPSYSAFSLGFDKRATFNLYFQEAKNRLKQLIGDNGKNRSMIETDGIMHRIPSRYSPSPSFGELLQSWLKKPDRTSSYGQKSPPKIGPKKMSTTKLGCKLGSITGTRNMERNTAKNANHKNKKFDCQMESKKQLRDFIYDEHDNGDNGNDKKLPKVSKSLWKLIMLPEHDQKYPDIEPFTSSRPTSRSLLQHPQETEMDILQSSFLQQGTPSPVRCISTFELQEHKRDSSPITTQKQKGGLVISDSLPLEGTEKINRDPHELHRDETKELAEIATESGHEEHGYLTLDRCEGKQSPSPIIGNISSTVLEHFSAKRKTQSPEEHSSLGAHLTNSNLCVNNNRFKFEYLTALLEASGLCISGAVDGLRPPDQLLDPSLYDEVETPLEEIPDDLKLFFDCVNEAVVETYRRSSDHLPWTSRFWIDPLPFPSGERLTQQVWKGLNRIFVSPQPAALEGTVRNDLDGGDWTDARHEAESVGSEVEDAIFRELLEQTVLEFLDVGGGF